jgi:putative Mn2+ efflux pump MntP
MNIFQNLMTVTSNIVSLIILLFIGFLFYLASVMDKHERKRNKVDKSQEY